MVFLRDVKSCQICFLVFSLFFHISCIFYIKMQKWYFLRNLVICNLKHKYISVKEIFYCCFYIFVKHKLIYLIPDTQLTYKFTISKLNIKGLKLMWKNPKLIAKWFLKIWKISKIKLGCVWQIKNKKKYKGCKK